MTALDQSCWDRPETPERYEAFYERHSRYRVANEQLIANARIAAGMSILDLGAGTGRTAETVLPFLGREGHILCVEPAERMRRAGESRLCDPRVRWACELPQTPQAFTRILCGAAIWQICPLTEVLLLLYRLLKPEGALCFTIPAMYLQEADIPGEGNDPWLLGLPAHLANGGRPLQTEDERVQWLYKQHELELALRVGGFRPESYRFEVRMTQRAYADWFRIPAISTRLMQGGDLSDWDRKVDEALRSSDTTSWKWERWYGCNAWKTETESVLNA